MAARGLLFVVWTIAPCYVYCISGWWHSSALFWKVYHPAGCLKLVATAPAAKSLLVLFNCKTHTPLSAVPTLYSNWLSRSVTDSLLAPLLFQTEEFLHQIIQPQCSSRSVLSAEFYQTRPEAYGNRSFQGRLQAADAVPVGS